jgi:starch-binding outer membrane protein, SusD/RagB family
VYPLISKKKMKMKKMFKLGFFALLFTAVSCNDATDIVQQGELNEDAAFKTVADLQTGLNAIYDSYTPDAGGNGSGDAVLFNDLFTDNMKRGFQGNGQGSSEFNFILQPGDTAPETVWGARYGTINYCNRVLRAYNRLEPTFTGANLDTAHKVKAQILALRALCHLDLFEYYTTDYQNPTALSVIKMDFVPALEDEFERNTVAEITEFIQTDLTDAASLIGDAYLDNKNYINKYFITAVNARLANDMGNSTLAASLVTSLEGPFTLSTPADYVNMFNDAANSGTELITSLKRLVAGDNRIGALYYANSVDIGGSPFLEASHQLYNLYAPGDVRLDVNFTDDSDPANDIILIGKYPGTSTSNLLVNDFKLFRLSEMELIKAEAQARLGDLAGAATTVGAIRIARNAGPAPATYANLTAALTDILLERRKELAFEGHRYLDLKRLGKELNIDVVRDQIDADSFAAPTTISSDDYRFTFPIPRSELDGNDNITQNPGYPGN